MDAVQLRKSTLAHRKNHFADAKETLIKVFRLLSGPLRPAVLNRSRKGENPYDFRRPENQHSHLAVNETPRWR